METVVIKYGIAESILEHWKKNESLAVVHKKQTDLDLLESYNGPPALIMYTSGTTGAPKAVVVPWSAMEARCIAAAKAYNITKDTVVAIGMIPPLVPECYSIVLETIRQGGKIIFPEAFTLETAPTIFFTYPGEKFPNIKTDKTEFVIFSSATVTQQTLFKGQRWARGATVVTWYGCRETGAVTMTTGESVADGYVGKPVPGMEIRVVDGVLQTRGAQLAYSYLDRPLTMDGDWFVMGDKGEMLEDGAVRTLGRTSPRF